MIRDIQIKARLAGGADLVDQAVHDKEALH